MAEVKKSLVDVPVRVNIWTRPECQRRQFEVLKQARPSIIFLQSDGGRNEAEWNAIRQNRELIDQGIDWECEVHRIYEEKNLGLYAMGRKVREYIWRHVDRCIFLEDDYVPAVSFFRYCAELLERYKDDKRIEMITGNNVFETYEEASQYDYFFSEVGWSIWGTATWRDRDDDRMYPLRYEGNEYVKQCLKDNLSAFWYNKVNGYCNRTLVDGHAPGGEYFHAVNSCLNHRMSIIPTRNMICNIGTEGEHAHVSKSRKKGKTSFFHIPVYELEFPLKHPDYVIDDKRFGEMYRRKLGHSKTKLGLKLKRIGNGFSLLIKGKLFAAVKRKMRNAAAEK